MKLITPVLIIALALSLIPKCVAQEKNLQATDTFEKVKMLDLRGGEADEIQVRILLKEASLTIESRKTNRILKDFKYSDIKSAEYSYSKHPRWKAGIGTAAGALLYPPVLLLALPVAIPLGFSKSKRHWLTIRTENDYAVLRLDGERRRLLLPAFEVRSGIKVEALGENK